MVDTVLTTSPHVIDEFKKSEYYGRLVATGARLSYICPLRYLDNPLCHNRPVITNSNKLRTYTFARYEKDSKILNLITGKETY